MNSDVPHATRDEFFKVEKEKLFTTETKNQHQREQAYNKILAFSELEDHKPKQELEDRLRIINNQNEFRQLQRFKEIQMEKEARRDRILDRQIEAELNWKREKRRFANHENFVLTVSECQQNIYDAEKRHADKKIELMEEVKNLRETMARGNETYSDQNEQKSNKSSKLRILQKNDKKAIEGKDVKKTVNLGHTVKDQDFAPPNTPISLAWKNQDSTKVNEQEVTTELLNEKINDDSVHMKEDQNQDEESNYKAIAEYWKKKYENLEEPKLEPEQTKL